FLAFFSLLLRIQGYHRDMRSFPTRRSSDLGRPWSSVLTGAPGFVRVPDGGRIAIAARPVAGDPLAVNLATSRHVGLLVPDFTTRDRKSTRLNSSHVKISYAVFCLKKKK